jgi:hypothetical protein
VAMVMNLPVLFRIDKWVLRMNLGETEKKHEKFSNLLNYNFTA